MADIQEQPIKSNKIGDDVIILAVFIPLGLVMLCGGLYWGLSTYRHLNELSRASGIVTSVAVTGSGGEEEYFPSIEFPLPNGRLIESTPASVRRTSYLGGLITVDSSDDGFETEYEVGDEVEVFYNPEDLSEVVLNDSNQLWVFPAVIGCLGGVFFTMGCLIGLTVLFKRFRRGAR